MAYTLEDEMLPILVKAFPRAFFPRGRSCMPLRVGIFEALDTALSPKIDRLKLKLYLGIYTKQPRYLRELILGAARIDLNGRPAGRVSAKQAASAAARLQKPQGPKFEPPLAKAAGALSAASAAVIPPALQAAKPRRLDFAGLPGGTCKKIAVQAQRQRVIVVVKKRKAILRDAQLIDFGSL